MSPLNPDKIKAQMWLSTSAFIRATNTQLRMVTVQDDCTLLATWH